MLSSWHAKPQQSVSRCAARKKWRLKSFLSFLCRSLGLSPEAEAALLDYFLAVLPLQAGAAGAPAARLLLSAAAAAGAAPAVLHAGSALLQRWLSTDLEQASQCLRMHGSVVMHQNIVMERDAAGISSLFIWPPTADEAFPTPHRGYEAA